MGISLAYSSENRHITGVSLSQFSNGCSSTWRQRIMWRTGVAAAIALCFAQATCAENLPNLLIVGEEAAAGAESSCWVTLRIQNTGISDRLSGWQLVCQVVPLGDASGTVSITDFATPSEYVFSDGSWGIDSVYDPAFGDIFFDTAKSKSDDLPYGVEVPPSGKNLLQIKLISSDAVGSFGILVVPDDGTGTYSNWISPDPLPMPNNFDVAPVPGGPEGVVASVEFGSVPEPPGSLMLVSGAVAMMLFGVAYRRCRLTFRLLPENRELAHPCSASSAG
jgi:hypothetical protein